MRSRFATLMLTLLLAIPVLAGEVSTPGVIAPPPPCTENCTTSSSTTTTSTALLTLIQTVLGLIRG